MALRKIDLMHQLFGPGEGTCANCSNYVSSRYHDRILRKCKVYGLTSSEASDWKKSSVACGMKNKTWTGNNVISMARRSQKKEDVLPGQLSLFKEEPCHES